MNRNLLVAFCLSVCGLIVPDVASAQSPRRLVLMAGRPSHPPRMHEFNAGVQLLSKCLRDCPLVKVDVLLNGWPKDESVFEKVDAVIFYMDGRLGHEAVQENGRRQALIDDWVKSGVGIGCMHYAVEVDPNKGGPEFKRWIGGHYEHMFSCNPIWEPEFTSFPDHPITRGVQPFKVKDEWYFNMRFVDDLPGFKAANTNAGKFQPILVA